RALMREDAALVYVAGEGDPGAFDGIPPKLLAQDHAVVRTRLSWFRKASLEGRVRWSIVGWPTEPWAKQVYPELEPLEAQRRLAEAALVDRSSRIGQTGRTYSNTLLDENAAAHIAFGAGFPHTREPGAPRVNQSALHLDVMIGTDDFEVTGVGARDRRVPL